MNKFIYSKYNVKKTLAERLAFLISNLGIKQSDFAQKIQFTQSYLSMVLSGTKISPSPRFYNAICREFSVNPEWLKNGKGEIHSIPGVPVDSKNSEILAKFQLLPRSEQHIIEEIIDALLLKSMAVEGEKAD